MPNVSEKKLKLLYIAQMLLEKTDGQHTITLPQMLEELQAKGVPAERKSLYDDLETLRRFGFVIQTRKTRTFEYYLANRPFSTEDLRLLIDAVKQAPNLSQRRVNQLVEKLAKLGSQYQREELLYPTGAPLQEEPAQKEEPPVPPQKEPEPSSPELLRWAMERDVQVSFQTSGWQLSPGGMVRQVEETVTVSPWRLFHQEGTFWLMAYDGEALEFRQYPLGEISQVRLLTQPREGSLPPGEKLTFEFSQEILSQVAARFEGALAVEQLGKGKLRATVKAPVDDRLFTWLFYLGTQVRLTAPKKVAEQFRERAKSLGKFYKS